jgi:carbonic anhydrase
MRFLPRLFESNRKWASERVAEDPKFFERLCDLQAPDHLWIGCADSRVPANQIVGLAPGEMFVHRNVGNVVAPDDTNCLSVVQYAVDVLRIKHIIVCGHYGCGGVQAALRRQTLGLIDNWLRHVQDVAERYTAQLDALADDGARLERLCELNAVEQALNVCRTTIVRDAWKRGQTLAVHAWIYGIRDGLVRDLGFSASAEDEVALLHGAAVRAGPG